jgi:hypothetical protein
MDPLAKLFGSAARLKLLRLFLFNDDTSFAIADAAYRARIGKEAARKELALLASIGILRKRNGAKGTAYQADKQFAYYEPLISFLRGTTSIGDKEVLQLFKKAGTLKLVALSGLFTGAQESKVDLIVVGDRLDEKSIAAAVRMIEAEIGRELRYAAFATEEFRYRQGVYDRLIRDAFDYRHRLILDKIGLK